MSLILYTHPRSRGRIARWMLEECGADYEVRVLEYGTSMQAEEYRRINPMRKVPALVHDEQVVTETAAICAYLADAFPEADLAPATSQRGAYYRWLFFAAGPLEAAIVNQALGVKLSVEQQGFVGYGELSRVLDTLDTRLQTSPWLAGDDFSAADLYVGAQIGFGLQFNTIEARPAFTDYWARLTARQAYQRANALDDQLMADAEG
ncbi:glutathione S-transferase family protein [Wenzhouxiangella marina]|uniref:Glutathione S-transferase n=1 Tax=Wenzhouxiangella marina TaxID=1579979 RepID=A0A0K0XSK0_9GAMM|nr:glutathione S-transferase family protein [Wenzhouxiangella marina]AKS40601.1 Glutathione S-transferase [Wenzhouxiangella marina]MBB6088369.1 glutathione S-transferase [Wenzhouxiangella marina]